MENTSSTNTDTKKTIYSDYGYISINEKELSSSEKMISFEKQNKSLIGRISKSSLKEVITVNLKTLYGLRKVYSFEVCISSKISVLVDKLIKEEETQAVEIKWKKGNQYRIISTNGIIKELNLMNTFIDEEIKNSFTLILASTHQILFSNTMKHVGIRLEEKNTIALNQSGNEDHLLVLCDKGYKSGSHYFEFTLLTEPCMSSLLLGITLNRNDYYFNPNDFKGFWGFNPSEACKVSEVFKGDIGDTCKINDKIGFLLMFSKTGLDVRLFINKVYFGVIFNGLNNGHYYFPCAILKFDGVKVKVCNRIEVPEYNDL